MTTTTFLFYKGMFVRDICQKVRKQTDLVVEFDDIAFRVDSGIISEFRTGCLRIVFDWVKVHASILLIDLYGPVYCETNADVIGHLKTNAWQAIIHASVEYVF
jgi:hypothetical protein